MIRNIRDVIDKRIIYIISNIDKSLAFEWIAASLQERGYSLIFILLNNKETVLEKFLKERQIPCYRIRLSSKKHIPGAVFQSYKLINHYKPYIIHCHLLQANLIGLLAGKLARVPKRIYTRHHSTFHHQYFPNAVWYDNLSNYLSTDIIAISQNVENVLLQLENVKSSKVHLIHHGFQLEDFSSVTTERVVQLKEKYNLFKHKYPIIGVISRYIHWKGIQYIISAFNNLLTSYPDATLLLVGGKGPYGMELKKQLRNLPNDSYVEVEFEHDIPALYKLLDIYVHVPINESIEAFGQTYIEALAAGVPSIFTLSGVAKEFIINSENALVVPFKNADAIHQGIICIIEKREDSMRMIQKGREDVLKLFGLAKMIRKLSVLYNK